MGFTFMKETVMLCALLLGMPRMSVQGNANFAPQDVNCAENSSLSVPNAHLPITS